ncbi:MAG: hypothetical protein V2I56_25470 [Desulfobacteraceae bacterium]|jgi:hypothetical protein|nr:hypothetical protein [Desulfobacteraceae bacterium]
MVEIRIYGKLRRYVQDISTGHDNVIRISPEPNETLEALLARLDIAVEKICSVFFNSKLLAARSGMASMVGYPQVSGNPYNWDLNLTLKTSDRIGLFGRDMAALVV